MENDWTADEVAALPQTDAVFEQPELRFNDHTWQQQGYMLHDMCRNKGAGCHDGGIPIPNGRLLVKRAGGYDLVSELTRK